MNEYLRLMIVFLASLISMFSSSLWAEKMEDGRVTHIAQLAHINIAYQDLGNVDDPVVVLVMGLGRQLTAWNDTLVKGLLNANLRVILFDNRDVGLSSKFEKREEPNIAIQVFKYLTGQTLNAPYLLTEMAKDTVALMDYLTIEQFHIAGTSLGGMIAQEVAIQYPERIRSLIPIMSTSGEDLSLPDWDIVYLMLMAPKAKEGKAKAVAHQQKLLKRIGSSQYSYIDKELLAYLNSAHERSYYPEGRRRQLIAVMASGDRQHALMSLKVPTLVIHGSGDQLIPLRHGERLAELVAGSTMALVEGMGHGLEPQVSKKVLEHMTRFILGLEAKI